jgi:phosphoribosylaminoimidazole-succinocarboxamide synthase
MSFDITLLPGWQHIRSGKVRDLYVNDKNELLLLASDRISAFDWVLPTPIPNKGKILTQLSLFWFELLEKQISNHLISLDVPSKVAGRAVIVKKLKMIDVECVARGYLTGSGLKEYQATGTVADQALPAGLLNGSELTPALFSPATKADIGDHDININYSQLVALVGSNRAEQLREKTLAIYQFAREYARSRGIIIADTKFEFGLDADDQLLLADEALTPDSSRFWDAKQWLPGDTQASFDKQFLRDWLVNSDWDQRSSPPHLPHDIVEKTAHRYEQAFTLLTGRKLK